MLAALAGCAHRGERAGEGEVIPGVSPAPRGLKFAVRVAPLKFTPGDRVTLEASLFNDSEDSYKKKFRSHCIWDYEVTTLDGIPLRAVRECIPQDTTMVLAPVLWGHYLSLLVVPAAFLAQRGRPWALALPLLAWMPEMVVSVLAIAALWLPFLARDRDPAEPSARPNTESAAMPAPSAGT